jgi:hypothetical protein
MKTRTAQSEFDTSKIYIPSFIQEMGFIDNSWHNDTSPSFEGKGIRIWVEYDDPDLREGSEFKYVVSKLDQDDDDIEDLLNTNDENELKSFLLTI